MRRLLPGMAALGALVITAPAQASFAPEAGSPITVGNAPYGVVTTDFNGDALPDVATVNGTSSNLSVLLRQPAGGFAQEAGSPFPLGLGPGYGAAADFNGDGRPDVATGTFQAGSASVLLRNAPAGFTSGRHSPRAPRARWPPPTSTATAAPTSP